MLIKAENYMLKTFLVTCRQLYNKADFGLPPVSTQLTANITAIF